MFKTKMKFYNRAELIFRGLFVLFVLMVWVFAYFKISTYVVDQNIKEKNDVLTQEKEELVEYEKVTDYKKFLLVKELEDHFTEMPWFEHIPKIIAIFEDLKNVDPSDTDTIVLSDFKVSLTEISLKWSVSSLKALYYSSPTWKFKALLEKFEELDFIEDMTIKNYEKVWDRYFEFVLNAKVVNNDTK